MWEKRWNMNGEQDTSSLWEQAQTVDRVGSFIRQDRRLTVPMIAAELKSYEYIKRKVIPVTGRGGL
jgi:hypothetical protein